MRYTIEAERNGVGRVQGADSEAQALDIIDDLVAAGFSITGAKDQDGEPTRTMDILHRFLKQGGDRQ